MKNLKIKKRPKTPFEKTVTVANLSKEYPGYAGREKYVLFTDMAEDMLLVKFSEEMMKLTPYIICSNKIKRVFRDYQANEVKHAYRASRECEKAHEDMMLGKVYEEPYVLPVYEITEQELAGEIWDETALSVFRKLYGELSENQKRRVEAFYLEGKTLAEIAEEEGVHFSAVHNCIQRAEDTMNKVFYKSVRKIFSETV